jgi:hypothetical protein
MSWEARHALFALLYLLLRRVVRLIAGSYNLDHDIELTVFRVGSRPSRQVGRSRFRRRDWLMMSSLGGCSLALGGRRSS